MKSENSGSGYFSGETSAVEVVEAYHERTKHHMHRYAASLGYLDWETQPDPFRRYAKADLIRLHVPPTGRPLPYRNLYPPNSVQPEELSLTSISLFFRYALSITAWKQYGGTTWSLRANPSSGNLHPTEGYAILPPIEQLGETPAVYHYTPKEHALERRAILDSNSWHEISTLFPGKSFLVGLSSIFWREAWKYGERAFRYCQHDVGHAIGALRIAAAALGWGAVLLDGTGDKTIAGLLGLNRSEDFEGAEREEPELLAVILTTGATTISSRSRSLTANWGAALWRGEANRLSREHRVEWPVIEEVAQATVRAENMSVSEDFDAFPTPDELSEIFATGGLLTAERAILSRRSAVAMDAITGISKSSLLQMLARLLPTSDGRAVPWDAIPWRPRIHLVIFLHRVDGLPAGLYALVRDPQKTTSLQNLMRPEFLWRNVSDPTLPLYLLQEGDCRTLATRLSCRQAIAGDGAFSLGMLADYTDSLNKYGAAFYRNLFWEAGMVGQILYLEAEEAGIRATGIGCYFDDMVHETLGLDSRAWQSFYHFTMGGPIEDTRLSTLPAYTQDR